ncbi:head-tail adaptor protein [Parasphingorhabdus sp.]|uniref:head-tail adaptor protein n=1 Tax=Parasphingorhabdus sp. TaxID=2709688 RepID=UPI003A95996E
MEQEFSGILRERISIERQTAGRDALGSAELQYTTVGVFWAAAEALHGGTASEAESRSAMPRWRFILRETYAIKPGDRLVWGDRIMTIASVIPEHRLIPKTILQAEEKR